MEEKPVGRTRLSAVLLFAFPLALIAVAAYGLLGADTAGAARYTVSECGWYVGHDAEWADTSDSKFIRSSYCQPPRTSDAFEGVHLTSETRSGTVSVSGNKFARWRWNAPAGTIITNIHGHRWQVVQEDFEHRLGGVTAAGFDPFMKLAVTDTNRRDFKQNLAPGTIAFESRLLCARAADKWCSTARSSLAGVRALTFTLEDPLFPGVAIGGELSGEQGEVWFRGARSLDWSAGDQGSGLRFAETAIDGAVRARTEHSCNIVNVGGQIRGSRMQPCGVTVAGRHTVETASLSDGPHQLRHCAIDFAGNTTCVPERTIRTDNTAPGSPRDLAVTGGDGWRNSNRFDLVWTVPDQGVAAPITASRVRVTGAGGYDSGPFTGTGPAGAAGLSVPGPGEYPVRIWLADAAGNEREEAATGAVLRFDDLPPTGYFGDSPEELPELFEVSVADQHSGVAGGTIAIRPAAGGEWRGLPTVLEDGPDGRRLVAHLPAKLDPGPWIVRAVIRDVAGNEAIVTTRGNGAQMSFRVPAPKAPNSPADPARPGPDGRAVSSLTARLIGARRSGLSVRVGYMKRSRLTGRLAVGDRGLAGRQLRVTERPVKGSRQHPVTHLVESDSAGHFRLGLGAGASRKVTVSFPGDGHATGSSVGPLLLRVRGAVSLRARPQTLSTGERIRFDGRVRTRFVRRPLARSVIQIQYLERSSGLWRPVLVTRTDRRGRYLALYRFRYVTGTARIRMRAVLLPSARLPYARGVSRPVLVRVHG